MIDAKYQVTGKIAIVVGAATGIGKATALTLAEAGADVTVADINARSLEQTAKEIRKLGCQALSIHMDVTRENQIRDTVEKTISQYGRVDILSYNVGILHCAPVSYISGAKFSGWENTQGNWDKPHTLEQWHRIIDTNLTGAFVFAQAVGTYMLTQRRGKIVVVSSISAEEGTPYQVSYNVSKAGLNALVRTLSAEWARFNINVNAIAPGPVDTALLGPFIDTPRSRKCILSGVPMRRLGKPEDMALLALYLASEASDFCTGAVFHIDGGCMGLGPGV